MKQLFYVVVAMVVLIGAAAAAVLDVPAAQDRVFKRAATAVLGQTPEPLDGMRVIVCGSASPLGRDPERAQACIAVVTAEHFTSPTACSPPQRTQTSSSTTRSLAPCSTR